MLHYRQIKHYPLTYHLKFSLRNMWNTIWRPSIVYPNTPGLAALVKTAGKEPPAWYAYGALPEALRQLLQTGSFLLYLCVPGCLLLLLLARPPFFSFYPQWRPFILCCIYITYAMLTLSCFINGWEQERMRWGDEPFYLCNAAIFIEIMRGYAQIFSKRTVA